MKKFFLCLTLLSVLFFFVSCGSSKKEDQNDSDEPQNDEDVVDTDTPDTEPAGDTEPSGDTEPTEPADDADSQPDDDADTDTTQDLDSCHPNPCEGLAHSTGECTSKGVSFYECGCDETYTWSTKSKTCELDPCEISDSYKTASFDQYYVFRGTSVIMNEEEYNNGYLKIAEKYYSELYFDEENDFTSFASFMVNQHFDDANDDVLVVYTTSAGDPNHLDEFYTSTLYEIRTFVPIDQFLKVLEEGVVEGYVKEEPNGRLTIDELSLPTSVISNDLHGWNSETQSFGEDAWYKQCVVAISQNADPSAPAKGSVQLCLEKDGVFDAGETLKLGMKMELYTDEATMSEYFEMSSMEDLCEIYCYNSHAIFDPTTEQCNCEPGYVWNEALRRCWGPCDSNPCVSVDHNNGVCTVTGESYECGCIDGYTWDGQSCI